MNGATTVCQILPSAKPQLGNNTHELRLFFLAIDDNLIMRW